MDNLIPDGVWPTMLTPFTEDNEVDYQALEALINWYIDQGVDGLFAVCQSSEMYYMSLEERVKVAQFTKKIANGRVPVIASGHISDNMKEQMLELKAMTDTGIDALVILSNHFARQDEDDEIWRKNAQRILQEIPDIPLGIYECPHPYKRLMAPELLRWCADTSRFYFLKDTSCDVDNMRAKMNAVGSTQLKIFNANAATLLDSLKIGISGFSGIMANFHPSLYVWLTQNWDRESEQARILQDILGPFSMAEGMVYPVNAKYHLKLDGVPIELYSRSKDCKEFSEHSKIIIEQMYRVASEIIDKWLAD
ncbi:MAG: dihydrodipicolinate synthase family protein [Clostridiales bacterium]|nr:dihydrodipicolinate synthase family protein [Clostridiales bacterium]